MKRIIVGLFLLFFSGKVIAQTPCDLLNLLVQKGTISQKEADSISEDKHETKSL